MVQQKPILRKLGLIFFSIAILLGILLNLVTAWPDMEARLYGFVKYTTNSLSSLSCPVLMTTLDREPVTIRLHNSLDKPIIWPVRAEFSAPLEIITVDEKVELQPGETKTISWVVGKENIDLSMFIFARVFAFPASSKAMAESTCGTFILPLPIKGGPFIFYLSLFLTALGIGVGLWLWQRHSDMSDSAVFAQLSRMRFITLVIAVGIIASILSWWPLAILTLALTLVTLSVFLIPRKV